VHNPIDNIRGAQRATLTPADIEGRITEAEADVTQLTTDHRRAALDAEANVPGAAERLISLLERLQAAQARVVNLRSALIAAQEEEELGRRRLQAKLRKDNLAKIAVAFGRRDEAADRLSQHIAAAVAAWHELLEASEKAALPVPGIDYPPGAMTGAGELRRAVERELFRLGAVALDHGRDFPGGQAYDVMVRDQPETIQPLPELLKDASRIVTAILRGEQLEAA
jgi:hypothetical protein